jgi:uncharacterized RDD family membrane protein YckC
MSPTDHQWAKGLFILDPLCIIFLVIMFPVFVFLEGIWGATLGKYLLGLRVISADGQPPGLQKSFLLNLLRLIDGLPAFNILEVFLIVTSKERARFGDRIARTRVVRIVEVVQPSSACVILT